ncbi:MAG: hypothetical protein V3T17_16120 [Pseudomonadales bacterium]
MKQYFDNIDTLKRFTSELDRHQDQLKCQHCSKNDQFVPHSFIYKQCHKALAEKVGKRIFCSNRYGHSGCGRPFTLYVASALPSLQYGTTHLFIFLSSLLANFTVKAAYKKATGQSASRNAWHWLTKVERRLMHYRTILKTRPHTVNTRFSTRSKRLQILLPTLTRLFSCFGDCPCANFQLLNQCCFI